MLTLLRAVRARLQPVPARRSTRPEGHTPVHERATTTVDLPAVIAPAKRIVPVEYPPPIACRTERAAAAELAARRLDVARQATETVRLDFGDLPPLPADPVRLANDTIAQARALRQAEEAAWAERVVSLSASRAKWNATLPVHARLRDVPPPRAVALGVAG